MAEHITIARPYAKAAFEFANEHYSVARWSEFLAILSEISKNEKINAIFHSDLKSDKIVDVIKALCGDKCDQFGDNFVRVMAENKRLVVLPDVFALFQRYCAEKELIADVEVVSATALTEVQLKNISLAMEKRLSKRVQLVCKIDQTLISGFIIRVDDVVIDNSIKGRLERLSNLLQS